MKAVRFSLFLVIALFLLNSCKKSNNNVVPINQQQYIFAGSFETSGYMDGNGATAIFNNPSGLGLDASDNLFVVDNFNSRIRKITSGGVVTTLAWSVGTATSTSFPFSIAIDAFGNYYIPYSYNNLIMKIDPAGTTTTFAGSGNAGYADGIGTAASFNNPYGVAADDSGNVYVSDTRNNCVRKITSSGIVSTYAGGNGIVNGFNVPTGIAVDKSGNVYVADMNSSSIKKISPSRQITTIAGSGNIGSANGVGTAASFYNPMGIAVDASGNVYVADTGNNLIRKITPVGIVSTFAGSDRTTEALSMPTGIVLDATGTYCYITDNGNNVIRKIPIQ